MRPIDIEEVRRSAPLGNLNAAKQAFGTVNELDWDTFGKQFPEDVNGLRTGLWAVGMMKCWYSEARLQQGEGHIDHFRPKRRLSGAQHSGYGWGTFDWKNFRLAHSTVNMRRTNYITRVASGKGSYFPLRDSSKRATCAAEEANEEPVLLDPSIAADTRLLCFDEVSGAPRPSYKPEVDHWRHKRAEESIKYYHLDEATWNARRADLMAVVGKLCDQLVRLPISTCEEKITYEQKIDEIVKYISPFAEFSSACLQVVRGKGLLDRTYSTSP